MSRTPPKKQAEIDHLKQKMSFARLEMRRQEQALAEAESEVMHLRDRLVELGVDVEALAKAQDAREWDGEDQEERGEV